MLVLGRQPEVPPELYPRLPANVVLYEVELYEVDPDLDPEHRGVGLVVATVRPKDILEVGCDVEPRRQRRCGNDRICTRSGGAGSYGQFWGMRSGSGLVPGSGDGLAVAETDAANDRAEALGAVQSAPVPLG